MYAQYAGALGSSRKDYGTSVSRESRMRGTIFPLVSGMMGRTENTGEVPELMGEQMCGLFNVPDEV